MTTHLTPDEIAAIEERHSACMTALFATSSPHLLAAWAEAHGPRLITEVRRLSADLEEARERARRQFERFQRMRNLAEAAEDRATAAEARERAMRVVVAEALTMIEPVPDPDYGGSTGARLVIPDGHPWRAKVAALSAAPAAASLPSNCHACQHYQGPPSDCCGIEGRSYTHAATERPVWCPLDKAPTSVNAEESRLLHDALAASATRKYVCQPAAPDAPDYRALAERLADALAVLLGTAGHSHGMRFSDRLLQGKNVLDEAIAAGLLSIGPAPVATDAQSMPTLAELDAEAAAMEAGFQAARAAGIPYGGGNG